MLLQLNWSFVAGMAYLNMEVREIIIDMSSIPPEVSRSIAERAKSRGLEMLDAPVTGNPKIAEAGKLGVMVGGEPDTLERVRSILECVSSVIVCRRLLRRWINA